ncbi:penicillin-binding protein [Corynebacterium kutscheri]|uniref:penicillin-binding transpeptidase domain-containing protein n=1 Tax=Corynebacterium kutscheri TaxID=35755 RepID=UPI000F6EDDE0|nr:penicillin-binding transpeptidase domain-containing protein [Corynebacterium kutscheri]VEH79868.1 penicillin-binding protein [Corynebacterium kutscheri]
MKNSFSAVLVAMMACTTLVACTPKPASAKPVVEEFLSALGHSEFAAAAELTDQKESVEEVLRTSYEGLQAESLSYELESVEVKDTIATATYTMKWALPRERDFEYETSMTLNRVNGQWSIRWLPSALHPQLAAYQHLELRAINAERSRVISSDGADVLVPGSIYRILVEPDQIVDAAATARAISNALQAAHQRDETVRTIDAAELTEQLKTASGTYSVTTVNAAQGVIVEQDLAYTQGVRLNEEAAMVATDPNFAPDIVSRVAQLVEEDLAGANGWRISTVTSDGVVMEDIIHHSPEVAPAVTVSLDHNIQRAAEEAVDLRADMKTMMVVMRASTGEILAVAQTDKADEDGAVALTGQYPPGSTFKILTAAAGIQRQGLVSGSPVACPGTMNIFGRTVTNYNGFSLGNTTLERAFARSCNTTFASISTDLDKGVLKDVAAQFGLGVDYDIPGLTTITGSVPEGETALEKTEAGYGQGYDLASPFGMALVSATAATGQAPTPTLISGWETKASHTPAALDPVLVEQLRTLMGSVTEAGGTAGRITSAYKVYAKTGEAEINGGSHAWFTGYRQEDDLSFATLVVLGGGSESAVAVTNRFFSLYDQYAGL